MRRRVHRRYRWRWYLLLVLIVILLFGSYQCYSRWQWDAATTAEQTTQGIAAAAKVSRSQRSHRTTSFDRTSQRAATFSARLTKALKAKKFSGSALVVKNNRVIYQQAFGWANAHKHQKNQVTSQFLINSLQKSMTGMLVMQAVQSGQIKLTDTLYRYYPQIKHSKQVTIRQMLNMEAGITGAMKPSTPLSETKEYRYAKEHAVIDTKLINQFNYQPICFVLLAGILHQVSHNSYYHRFYQQIVTPLNLNHTSFVQLRSQTPAMTLGYKGTIPGTFSTPMIPALKDVDSRIGTGNVTMSSGDVFRTIRAVIQGSLLTKASGAQTLLEANDNQAAHYTGGLYHLDKVGYYGHGVGNFYEDTFVLSRDGKTGVVFLSNNFYKHTMWPTWSTETLAKETFKTVNAASRIK